MAKKTHCYAQKKNPNEVISEFWITDVSEGVLWAPDLRSMALNFE